MQRAWDFRTNRIVEKGRSWRLGGNSEHVSSTGTQ